MHPIAEPSVPIWLGAAALAFIAACGVVWILVAVRWAAGLPVIPYQPRRQVPWDGIHLLLTLAIYFALILTAGKVIDHLLPAELAQPNGAGNASAEHVITKMLQASHKNPRLFLVALLAAVVVAPIVEEFFFRVLLQGWLEKLERRRRHRVRRPGRILPLGAGPILTSSLLFAAMHFRVSGKPAPPLVIAAYLIANAVAELAAMTCIVVLLRVRRGARAADFGWAPAKLLPDAGLGLLAFLAITPPLSLAMVLLHEVVPEKIAADPLPLFFLALVLGTLYYRTHRIVPSIVAHATLNATTLLLYWHFVVR